MTREHRSARWSSAWPDALGFVIGLGGAWIAGWTATDLVWSLWLSSLVVGYATIVWTIIRPGVDIARGAWRERTLTAQVIREYKAGALVGTSILLVGGLFMLAFFTVHFGGFHYVHSLLLNAFFPLDGSTAGLAGTAGMSTYLEVARRYWQFLPSAFLAERAGFLRPPALTKADLSVTADAIAARKAANAQGRGLFVAPYRNVVRMHALIFFFAFAHFAGMDSFAVFTVVYAAYFFPWRLVKKGDQGPQGAQGRQGANYSDLTAPRGVEPWKP